MLVEEKSMKGIPAKPVGNWPSLGLASNLL